MEIHTGESMIQRDFKQKLLSKRTDFWLAATKIGEPILSTSMPKMNFRGFKMKKRLQFTQFLDSLQVKEKKTIM